MASKRKKIYWAIAAIAVVVAIAAASAGPFISRVEQPDYQIESSEGAIEVRHYGPMIAAEATVKGDRKSAIGEGFRIIAAYIFGANNGQAKIEMTAPVQQQRPQEIAMTAPVTQQGDGDTWSIRFIMPRSWTMPSLPKPNDERIRLMEIQAKRMVVIRFSGTADEQTIREKTDEAKDYLRSKKLAIVDGPILAFYNPPWTLPFLRRNEIMFEVPSL